MARLYKLEYSIGYSTEYSIDIQLIFRIFNCESLDNNNGGELLWALGPDSGPLGRPSSQLLQVYNESIAILARGGSVGLAASFYYKSVTSPLRALVRHNAAQSWKSWLPIWMSSQLVATTSSSPRPCEHCQARSIGDDGGYGRRVLLLMLMRMTTMPAMMMVRAKRKQEIAAAEADADDNDASDDDGDGEKGKKLFRCL